MAAIRRFFLLAVVLAVGVAQAFPIAQAPQPVVEYYNVYLGHYFMTIAPAEMASIESGQAGPGWVRTGYAFLACPLPGGGSFCTGTTSATVQRFYGTPGLGPNSHFYTADPTEAAILKQPGTGWTFEDTVFQTGTPPSPAGCVTGTPVYRLYNQRAAFNDSNHRYVTSGAERARMVARGWIDEGIRFCSDGAVEVPIKQFTIALGPQPGQIRPSAECEDESIHLGPCIAVNNLPVPASLLSTDSVTDPPFAERTGLNRLPTFVLDASRPLESASNVFVQIAAPDTFGLHVDTRSKGPNAGSSINPLYQFTTGAPAGKPDLRIFPFGVSESEVELQVSFNLFVKTIEVRSAGGSAFGHTTLELIDQRSGKHVYFTTLAYGTVPEGTPPVYIAFDTFTGRPIVGTSMRTDSPYIRPFGLPSLPTPSGFVSPHPWGWGGAFEFRVNRDEFTRIIASWRTLVPELSTDPADYFFDNFHFNNEIGGDGEIGIWLQDYQVRLIRR